MSGALEIPEGALSARLQLRFADLNAAGHVANTAVPVLFDEARGRMLGFPGIGGGLLDAAPGTMAFVGQASAEYLREMHYSGQDVEVRAWVSGLGRSRFALSLVLLDGEDVAALGENVLVLVDAATSRPVPLPDALRERLAAVSGPAVPLRGRLTGL